MSSSIANSRPARLGLVIALLLPAGWMLRLLERPLLPAAPIGREQLLARSGRGGVMTMLGGLRAVVAGGLWLQANLAWERRDAEGTRLLIASTVAADERPLYFWLNGARMQAYDFPAWLPPGMPGPARQKAIRAESERALAFLEKGLRWHGPHPAIYVEMAHIHLRLRHDPEAAARCYRLAAERPGAPYYAGRLHADLLEQLGRPEEALNWLRQMLPTLPTDDPAARRAVVEARIKALEEELAGR